MIGQSSITQATLGAPDEYIQREAQNRNLRSIKFYVGFQLNGLPHAGTAFTLGMAFCLANRLINKGMNSKVEIAFLDNVYYEKDPPFRTRRLIVVDKKRCKTYETSFRTLIGYFSDKFHIDYDLLSYDKFQKKKAYRDCLKQILSLPDDTIKAFDPTSGNGANIGLYCSRCLMTNLTKPTKFRFVLGRVKFTVDCSVHGTETVFLDGAEYIDTGAIIRNVIKEAIISKTSLSERTLPVIVKGRDWAPLSHFVSLGLSSLNIPSTIVLI